MTYELTVILKEEKPQDIKKAIEALKGQVLNLTFWQKRKLTFKIKKESFGFYYICDFEISPEQLPNLDKKLILNPIVLRHLIVAKPKFEKILPAGRQGKIEKAEIPKVEAAKPKIKKVVLPKAKKRALPEKVEVKEKVYQLESEKERLKKLDEKLKKILEE